MAIVTPLIIDGNRKREFDSAGDALPVYFSFETVTTTPYNAADVDIILADPTTAGQKIVINLPLASTRVSGTNTRYYVIKHIGSNRVVDVVPQGGEQIDGQGGKITLGKLETVTLVSDGNDWWIGI